MIKILKILTAFIFISTVIWAQDEDSSSKRNIMLKMVDTRGRPIQDIVVGSLNNTQTGVTDRNGLFVFNNMTDKDSINVVLSSRTISIPVNGMDSIVITQRNARSYFYSDLNGNRIILERTNINAGSLLDVPTMLEQQHSSSLIELLRGRVPGLSVGSNNNATIRGPGSINMSNEPLVVVDGIPYGTLNEANNLLNVYDLQTIEVLNSASEYGVRGANGVILIKTKTK